MPSLNLGNRQKYRARSKSIFDRSFSVKKIISVINNKANKKFKISKHFGKGDSAQKILKNLQDKKVWNTSKQKHLKII